VVGNARRRPGVALRAWDVRAPNVSEGDAEKLPSLDTTLDPMKDRAALRTRGRITVIKIVKNP
jgi:hypothetical protein